MQRPLYFFSWSLLRLLMKTVKQYNYSASIKETEDSICIVTKVNPHLIESGSSFDML